MGLTHIAVLVGNSANSGEREEARCLVDSGAIYSLIPEPVLRRLGILPHSKRDFVLTNGDVVGRRLATAPFEYEGRRGDSMLIVGEPVDDPLLEATTLEGLGAVLAPFRRELRRWRCRSSARPDARRDASTIQDLVLLCAIPRAATVLARLFSAAREPKADVRRQRTGDGAAGVDAKIETRRSWQSGRPSAGRGR